MENWYRIWETLEFENGGDGFEFYKLINFLNLKILFFYFLKLNWFFKKNEKNFIKNFLNIWKKIIFLLLKKCIKSFKKHEVINFQTIDNIK